MSIALVSLVSIAVWCVGGRRFADASVRAWKRKDPRTASARFFFPVSTNPFRVAKFDGWPFGCPEARSLPNSVFSYEHVYDPASKTWNHPIAPESAAAYKLKVIAAFPALLAYSCLMAFLYVLPTEIWGRTLLRLARAEADKELPVAKASLPEKTS